MGNMTAKQARHMLSLVENYSEEQFEALQRTGVLSDIFNCENPSRVDRYSLQRVLEGEHLERVFTPFLTCEVGGKSKDELITELETNGMFVSDWANDIMRKPAWIPGEREMVEFGRATVKELGFTKNPTWQELLDRIEKLGHGKCEPQDGPSIRLALKDQSVNDWFWCAMELITDSDGCSCVFYVKRFDDGGRWLKTYWFNPAYRLNLGRVVVFRLGK